MPDDLAVAARLSTAFSQSMSTPSLAMEPGIPGAVLRAVATMARTSKRHQAEFGIALLRAGLRLEPDIQAAALQHLFDVGSISGVIVLDDGGILLSVTSSGMDRAYR